ncbi:Cyclin-H1-1, partial [Cucurbita argyrosperma subsp. sororia]
MHCCSPSLAPPLAKRKSGSCPSTVAAPRFLSSHGRAKWILDPQELICRYKAANQRAFEALEKFGATLMEVDADGSLSVPDPQINSKDNALSIEEEQFMRVFYENKLQEVCNNFHFPHKIQTTALIYFKRFYLQWSVMQHNPKYVMLTCIYAACKIEENHVSAEELVKGYVNDMEELFHENTEMLQMLKETAMSEVDNIMLTDAPLLFPPGQEFPLNYFRIRFMQSIHAREVRGGRILCVCARREGVGIFTLSFRELALAALRRSNQGHGAIDFDRHLDSILSRQKSAHTIYELFERINSIESWTCLPIRKGFKAHQQKIKILLGTGLQ